MLPLDQVWEDQEDRGEQRREKISEKDQSSVLRLAFQIEIYPEKKREEMT